VRPLDIRDSAKPFLGEAGQFGGNHRGGTAFGFADGSVRFFAATSTNRPVIQALFTIAGAGFDPIPGE
jgi:prepilin-type processing-associated H-X9-DG protein